MKKTVFCVALVLLLFASSGLCENVVIPLEIGKVAAYSDLFEFWITGMNFKDRFECYKEVSGWSFFVESGNTFQYLNVECSILNISLSDLNVRPYFSAILMYDNYYPFEGDVLLRDLNRSGRICYFDFPYGMLEEGKLCFLFEVPNIVETSNKPIVLNLMVGEKAYSIKLR